MRLFIPKYVIRPALDDAGRDLRELGKSVLCDIAKKWKAILKLGGV